MKNRLKLWVGSPIYLCFDCGEAGYWARLRSEPLTACGELSHEDMSSPEDHQNHQYTELKASHDHHMSSQCDISSLKMDVGLRQRLGVWVVFLKREAECVSNTW